MGFVVQSHVMAHFEIEIMCFELFQKDFRIKFEYYLNLRAAIHPKTIPANGTKDLLIFVCDMRQVSVGCLAVVIVTQNMPIIKIEKRVTET